MDLLFNVLLIVCESSVLFCYALHYVHSRFEIILKGKRKLLVFSYRCFVTFNVLRPFFTVPLVGLQYVIVVFSVHIHL